MATTGGNHKQTTSGYWENNIGPVGTRHDRLGKIKTLFSCIPELTTSQEQLRDVTQPGIAYQFLPIKDIFTCTHTHTSKSWKDKDSFLMHPITNDQSGASWERSHNHSLSFFYQSKMYSHAHTNTPPRKLTKSAEISQRFRVAWAIHIYTSHPSPSWKVGLSTNHSIIGQFT